LSSNNYCLRDLYRTIEETPSNPISIIQSKLDNAVKEAYGMSKKDSSLEFILKLNQILCQKEKNGEIIQGPGLPSFIEDKSKYISSDCLKMN